MPAAMTSTGIAGRPGRKASAHNTTATMAITRGYAITCFDTSSPSRASEAARVTMMPVAVAMMSAGTCVTMPSPTVSSV